MGLGCNRRLDLGRRVFFPTDRFWNDKFPTGFVSKLLLVYPIKAMTAQLKSLIFTFNNFISDFVGN